MSSMVTLSWRDVSKDRLTKLRLKQFIAKRKEPEGYGWKFLDLMTKLQLTKCKKKTKRVVERSHLAKLNVLRQRSERSYFQQSTVVPLLAPESV